MYAGLLVERENRQQTDREKEKRQAGKMYRGAALSPFFLFFSLLPHGVQYGSFVISAR
jgi:hypothetical protein